MRGSFEDGEVIVRMSPKEAQALSTELFYTIDYRPEGHPEYAALQQALYDGLRKDESA